jgi:hypothetical protein
MTGVRAADTQPQQPQLVDPVPFRLFDPTWSGQDMRISHIESALTALFQRPLDLEQLDRLGVILSGAEHKAVMLLRMRGRRAA